MDPTTTASTEAHAHVSVAPRTLRRALALIHKRAAREPRVNPMTRYPEMPGELSIRELALARALGLGSRKSGQRIVAALRALGYNVRSVKLGRGRGGFVVITAAIDGTFRGDIPGGTTAKMSHQNLVSDSVVSGKNKVSRRSTPTTTSLPETPKATPTLSGEQREVVDHYWDRFKAKRGCEPMLPSKWALVLGEKATQHGKAKAMECVDRFFEASHPFITGGNYHVPALLWVWGELLAGGPVDKAEVEHRRKLLHSIGKLTNPKHATAAEVNEAYEAWSSKRAYPLGPCSARPAG